MNKHSKLPVVGILGTNGSVSSCVGTLGLAMDLAGQNTGNLVYHYAADRHLLGPRLHLPLNPAVDWAQVRRSIDILHIPAANQLNPAFDVSLLADVADFLDKPIFIAGLGMQCELSEAPEDVTLNSDALRFIDVLKRLAPGVGVRGVESGRMLQRHGIGRAVVTGCPSNFINRSITGSTIAAQLDRVRALTLPRIDFFPGTLSNHRPTEAKLRSLTAIGDYRYVLQTNRFLFDVVDGHGDEAGLSYLDWERAQLFPDMPQCEYNALYRTRGAYYFSAPAWIDDAGRRDLGIGMRMHGVVATIQGGAAGVCVVADGRIKEMVDTMGYPHLTVDDVAQAGSLAELLAMTRFSPGDFDAARAHAFAHYRQLARETGLSVDETAFPAA